MSENTPRPRRLLNSGLSAHGPRRFRRDDSEPEVPPTDPPADNEPPADPDPAPAPPAPADDAPADASASQAVTVPDGMTKVADLTDWVGEDTAKAQAVLEWENEKPEKHRRKTLVSDLTNIILEG